MHPNLLVFTHHFATALAWCPQADTSKSACSVCLPKVTLPETHRWFEHKGAPTPPPQSAPQSVPQSPLLLPSADSAEGEESRREEACEL
eukprot:768345-Hanusia_phi.AAC.1